MEFLHDYGLFLAKTATLLILIGGLIYFIARGIAAERSSSRDKLEVKKLNTRYEEMALAFKAQMLPEAEFKKAMKEEKQREKEAGKTAGARPRVFVLNFDGDIRASAVSHLREEITAALTIARPEDEFLVRLHSPGGLVHAYGLAASQLTRIRKRGLQLTVAVDKVAASGGYMMAAVANRIIAAPFAVVGSIGVLAQVPNFNRLLKKHDIDYEQFTAGEFKRTVTVFGENTDAARKKFRDDIEHTHQLFKDFIVEYRPNLDLAQVATGEHWHGIDGLRLKLVDELSTSDDYLMARVKEADVYEVIYTAKKPLSKRVSGFLSEVIDRVTARWREPSVPESFY